MKSHKRLDLTFVRLFPPIRRRNINQTQQTNCQRTRFIDQPYKNGCGFPNLVRILSTQRRRRRKQHTPVNLCRALPSSLSSLNPLGNIDSTKGCDNNTGHNNHTQNQLLKRFMRSIEILIHFFTVN